MITCCKEDAQKMLSGSLIRASHKKGLAHKSTKLFCSAMVNLLHLLPIGVALGIHVMTIGAAIMAPLGTDVGLRKAVF